ncbi:hypothetical protein [Jiangella alba]|uniref:Uncharacterized protein n=1 Tax=Jiangella alba TaxID=561176 RepID=A0A1H5PS61_9ACTN|nr:hypothetical protein [Jiangella alba]SEF16559.1 hypothetical protein SAMN04488561_5432 [Jiangella alba]
MTPMIVRYARPMPVAALVVGVLLLALSLLDGRSIGMFTGVVLTLLGILQLVNPMLRIDAGEVRLCNPLGMTLRRFAVSSPADLTIDGKALRHVPTGKKIASLGFGADKSDVAALRSQLQPA